MTSSPVLGIVESIWIAHEALITREAPVDASRKQMHFVFSHTPIGARGSLGRFFLKPLEALLLHIEVPVAAKIVSVLTTKRTKNNSEVKRAG